MNQIVFFKKKLRSCSETKSGDISIISTVDNAELYQEKKRKLALAAPEQFQFLLLNATFGIETFHFQIFSKAGKPNTLGDCCVDKLKTSLAKLPIPSTNTRTQCREANVICSMSLHGHRTFGITTPSTISAPHPAARLSTGDQLTQAQHVQFLPRRIPHRPLDSNTSTNPETSEYKLHMVCTAALSKGWIVSKRCRHNHRNHFQARITPRLTLGLIHHLNIISALAETGPAAIHDDTPTTPQHPHLHTYKENPP